jgi:hypothetical protein
VTAPRVALVGAGAIAPFHVAALRAVGFQVDHVAGSSASRRAEAFATDQEIPHYWSDPTELVESEHWDALVLACATEALPDLLRRAVRTQRPCLVEKPLSFDSGVILGFDSADEYVRVAYNRRFYAAVAAARRFADDGPCLIRLELPEAIQDPRDGDDGLRAVRENSIHGLDLLQHIVGPYRLDGRLEVSDPRARLATFSTTRGHIGSIVLNWNVPANFSLVLDRAPRRFELRPFELGSLYEGMEVLEPSSEMPVRRYVPKLSTQVTSFPGPDGIKPGFREQAHSLLQRVQSGQWDSRSATLQQAAFAVDVARALTIT